jgi:hypothetical protein
MMGRPHDRKMIDWLTEYCKVNKLELPTKVSGEDLIDSSQSQEPVLDGNGDLVFFKCDVCNITSSSFQTHNAHIKGRKHQKALEKTQTNEWANSLFKCELCCATMNTQEVLNKHLGGKAHLRKLKMQEAEQQAVTTTANLQKSQKVAKIPGNFSCDLCSVSVNSEDLLKTHLQGKSHKKKLNLQNDTTSSFHCDVCDIDVTSSEMLENHINGKKHASKLRQKAEGEAGVQEAKGVVKQEAAVKEGAAQGAAEREPEQARGYQQQVDHCEDLDFETQY